MTNLVIFDLDGTLLDTIDDLAVSVNHVLQLHGYSQHELSQYRFFVGNGVTKLIERALPEDAREEATIMQLRREFVAYYDQHNAHLTHPYAGIPELLQQLRRQNITLAVASNKYHRGTVEMVRHFFGEEMFALVLGQRDEIPVKPDPAIVNEILVHCNTDKADVLYVGDSGVDMQTAKNGGVASIGVTWGFRSRQELEMNGATHIVGDPGEILSFVK